MALRSPTRLMPSSSSVGRPAFSDAIARAFVLAAIEVYRRFLSPFKGFSCAYRVHTGHASCSMLGYRAVRRHGVLRGVGILRSRLSRCGVAYRRFETGPTFSTRRQRGFCEPGCDLPCDGVPDLFGPCDAIGCCFDLEGCDGPTAKKRKDDEQHIHIPPNARLSRDAHRSG